MSFLICAWVTMYLLIKELYRKRRCRETQRWNAPNVRTNNINNINTTSTMVKIRFILSEHRASEHS